MEHHHIHRLSEEDRQLIRELIFAMSLTSDAITSLGTSVDNLETAVSAVPSDTDDATNADAIAALGERIDTATSTLTGDETPPAPVPSVPVDGTPDAPVDAPVGTADTSPTQFPSV